MKEAKSLISWLVGREVKSMAEKVVHSLGPDRVFGLQPPACSRAQAVSRLVLVR